MCLWKYTPFGTCLHLKTTRDPTCVQQAEITHKLLNRRGIFRHEYSLLNVQIICITYEKCKSNLQQSLKSSRVFELCRIKNHASALHKTQFLYNNSDKTFTEFGFEKLFRLDLCVLLNKSEPLSQKLINILVIPTYLPTTKEVVF